ncbi:diguanylate cyclase (GGDEF)-like protein [Kibdelosporangium banguiense]|uniref:Diguanylate cyclase (GGDEF)-like protein n=1 Tax=Kibdelosporangium banguiense TaxID=1365924 RepID=A0ABS4TLT7_9PSEU|nr:GGDEF domain-containing protein [Kibdelosporangium banguiense]MBP2324851.1 diguanylate cyclase (GGDEF)-like protein [Kibdelosporangium banguiense]
MRTGGIATAIDLSPPGRWSHVHVVAVLTGILVPALVLAPAISWLTALVFALCGLVHAELARHRALDTPGVPTAAVWIIGAVLVLPLAAVLVVAVVLHAHELLRGARDVGRVLASVGGATLAWLVWPSPADVMSTPAVLVAGLAGLAYLVMADGPALLGVVRRPILAVHPAEAGPGVYGNLFARAALGVLLGLFAHFSVFVVPFILLPAAYLQRAMRGRALHHAAAHDAKTQLWNHAAWQTLSTAALASHRARARSAVLMVDLDHFKRLNDTYGHQAGDDVLTSVAHVLQTTTRRGDIVARFGGEEFSILLPGVTEHEANEAAERIRHRIEALDVTTTNLHGQPTTISGVTASIGVATTHHTEAGVDDLLVKADRFLYEAKELGRNRVCGPALAAAA